MSRLIKSTAGLVTLLGPDVQSAQGPVCMTCGRLVTEEQLVEGYPGVSTFAKILVRHHGAEELRTFEMGSSNWDEKDLSQMMRGTNWFDPTREAGLGQNVKITPSDAWVDPEPTRIISDGGK